MVKVYWKKFVKAVEARKQEERVVLLLALLTVLGYGAFVLWLEPLQLRRAELERQIAVANMQLIDETTRQDEIKGTSSTDPNEPARLRQAELQTAVANANEELDRLYGQLIDPREMSMMLTRILQQETTLELVSLSNTASEPLMTGASSDGVELYRHGLKMVFQGGYLDTVRYLQSLEDLETNFFWERMEYEVQEYPKARITLDIYTLSSQRGWIGV